MRQRDVWALSDGRAGIEVQCLGLAEALGLTPDIKRLVVREPWRWIQPWISHGALRTLAPESDPLEPPWPDLVIASGRRAVAPTLEIRRVSGGRTRTIFVQDPRVDPRRFDLVVAPSHDRLSGPNVITTLGSIHRVTGERLTAAAERMRERFRHVPHPRVAVLIGGKSRSHRLSPDRLETIMAGLDRLVAESGAGLMITTSRRTGADNVARLKARFDRPETFFWDGQGENPYFAFLALSQYILVTEDSANMVSEAASTGKPVLVMAMDGGSAKFNSFYETMAQRGAIRRFAGRLERWPYPPLDEPRRAAREIARRLPELALNPI